MKKLVRVFAGVAVLMVSTFAYADTALTPTAQIATDLTQIVGFALGTVVMALVALVLKKIHDRYGIDVPQAWLQNVQSLVDHGIAYAEEQGNKAIINNTTLTGNEKLNLAATFVLSMTNDKALIAMGETKIKQLIEARLNLTQSSPVNGQTLVTDPPAPVPVVAPVVTAGVIEGK